MTEQNVPEQAGPNGDGSKSLARESKYGQAVTFVATIGALALASGLSDLDLSTLPGWAKAAAATAIGTAVGLLTAYGTRNRTKFTDGLK